MDEERRKSILEAAAHIFKKHSKSKDPHANHCAGCLLKWDEVAEWPCPLAELAAYAFDTLQP